MKDRRRKEEREQRKREEKKRERICVSEISLLCKSVKKGGR